MKPHFEEWGEKIDAALGMHWPGKAVALRFLSTQNHPQRTTRELADVIEQTGTDRYDTDRPMAVAHEMYAKEGCRAVCRAEPISK
jgi:hypothetical protein